LKSTNGHASWNVLNKQQNLIDHTPVTLTPFPSPSPCHSLPLNGLDATSISVVSSDPILLTTPIEMQGPETKLSKRQIVTMNSRNMEPWQVNFFLSYDYDAFLLGKMDLNCGRKKKIK